MMSRKTELTAGAMLIVTSWLAIFWLAMNLDRAAERIDVLEQGVVLALSRQQCGSYIAVMTPEGAATAVCAR